MSNFDIKINLSKLKNSFAMDVQGKNSLKKCICIPIEDNELFIGEKGTYLDLRAVGYKEQKYKDTHFVKLAVSKERYEQMKETGETDTIVGGMKPSKNFSKPAETTPINNSVVPDDLPF